MTDTTATEIETGATAMVGGVTATDGLHHQMTAEGVEESQEGALTKASLQAPEQTAERPLPPVLPHPPLRCRRHLLPRERQTDTVARPRSRLPSLTTLP